MPVTVQAPANAVDAAGGPSVTWETRLVGFARRDVLKGRELESAQRLAADIDEALTVRASSSLAGITPAWRVTSKGREFNIRHIEPVGASSERPQFYRIMCARRAA